MFITPPKLKDLPAGYTLLAGLSHSTVIPDMDFETYSEAGYIYHPNTEKYSGPFGKKDRGLPVIGAAAYSEHPSTEVLCLAYDLKDGHGKRSWQPGKSGVCPLLNHIVNGGLIEAWNISFEYWIWTNVCVPKYGFPPLSISQLRCAQAKARAFALPSSLHDAGIVLDIEHKKHIDGKRLLHKFSMPRTPTKHDKRRRIYPHEDMQDAQKLYDYNLQDIAAEAELSSLIPDLSPTELEFWLCDQVINRRGVQIDIPMLFSFVSIIDEAYKRYNAELQVLTDNKVKSYSEVAKIRNWMMERGVSAPDLEEETILELLKLDLSDQVKRVIKIRQLLAFASVKKVYSMLNQVTKDDRLHDLFIYHSARTGRAAGAAIQPQNLPNSGPRIDQCSNCKNYFKDIDGCPVCDWFQHHSTRLEWNSDIALAALETISTGDLDAVEHRWGDALETLSGCLRALFISKPGHDFICSDYSAIEAVVLAALAGEQWRLNVFNTHGLIYETSASKVTGVPLESYIQYKKHTGGHHPDRKKGKVFELALGYGGWINACKNFGADKFMSNEEIKQAILAWREASPAVVEFWGGQKRGWWEEYFGLEGAAVQAVMYPGQRFEHRGISYIVNRDVLYCQLLSGRFLTYHKPRLDPSERRPGTKTLSFEGWNTNAKYGRKGWVRMETYGGKLTENVVQATARDILAHAIVNLEKRSYPVVLHVHDEIVSEIPELTGSLREFEEIMSSLPTWASTWPVRAKGGWRGKRYGK